MRSIGKVKIKKLKKMVQDTARNYQPLALNSYQLQEDVKGQVPEEWLDTWESAWSEIERIIGDEINLLKYGRE